MLVLLCFLNPTSAFDIRCIINQLNTNKVVVPMGLKQIYPTCLKTAKVVPVDKAGDKNEVTNYRPVSILSIFSKIYKYYFIR